MRALFPTDLELHLGRFATREDLPALADLSALCFPTREPRAPLSFFLFPTIVVAAGADMVAYGSFALAPSTMLMVDTAVHPESQRQGIASALVAERLRLGLLMSSQILGGGVAPNNVGMRAIFDQAGFTVTILPGDPPDRPVPAHTYNRNPVTLAWISDQYRTNYWLTKGTTP
jgi:ribosomal protein S18 acetylase RimI-like enzyme